MASQSKDSDGANSDVYAKRREKVAKLLIQGTNEKLQRANTKKALETIYEARKMAQELLLTPWPQIAAYRLAHLLFRDRNADLRQVRELLLEAMHGNFLGPMPKIYELAVLHRMKSEVQEIEACFEGAISLIRHLANDKRSESDLNDGLYQTAVQDCAVNLVELSAYFLGLPHDELLGLTPDGSSKVFAGLGLGKSSWKLVGRDPGLAKISYPRALAEAELEALGKKHGAVLVKQSEDKMSVEWKFPGGNSYSPLGPVQGKALLQLIDPSQRLSLCEPDQYRKELRIKLKTGLNIDYNPIPPHSKTLHEDISIILLTLAHPRSTD